MTGVTKPDRRNADAPGMGQCGFGSAPEAGAPRRRPGALAGTTGVLAAGLAVACSGAGSGDVQVARCLDVLRYRMPELAGISVESVTRGPRLRSIAFAASAAAEGPGAAPAIREHITCRFSAGDPWSLTGAAIGGRRLSPGEIALVNAELLLNDLSRHPERLGEPSEPPAAS